MSTFNPISKSSQSSFSLPSKGSDTFANLSHSDIEGAGFDVQAFDDAFTGFDTPGNVILTVWSVQNKETP